MVFPKFQADKTVFKTKFYIFMKKTFFKLITLILCTYEIFRIMQNVIEDRVTLLHRFFNFSQKIEFVIP